MQLAGKVALITGAGSGLGKVYAQTLAREGAAVVIGDIDGAKAREAATEIESSGARAAGVEMDVGNEADVHRTVDACIAQFGGVDILINNAGLARGRWNLCLELSNDEWTRILAVNVVGSIACARRCRPIMAQRGGGVVINQSSMAAYSDINSAYSISKLAVSGLTVAMAAEMAGDNIRVNGIAPGMMTGRLPPDIVEQVLRRQLIARRVTPEDLVGALLFLCTNASMFVTGQTLVVDGGVVRRP